MNQSPERLLGETFEGYQQRRAANNRAPQARVIWNSRRQPARTVDVNRRDRRAIVREIGIRQFKKLYKEAKA